MSSALEGLGWGDNKGAAINYLGVHFDTNPGWRTQRSVIDEKIREKTDRMNNSTINMEQAIYTVNTAIIPMVLYPLQVAVMPDNKLDEWDRKLRQAVAKAGKLQASLPVACYYLKKEDGGIGLKSIKEA